MEHVFPEHKYQPSPNTSGEMRQLPDAIVLHYTASPTAESAITTLCDPSTKASAHAVVDRDGSVTQLVPFNQIAWHAGASKYRGRSGFNAFSIGIEMVNAGRLKQVGSKSWQAWFGQRYGDGEVLQARHQNGREPDHWHVYTAEQIEAVEALCRKLVMTYPIDTLVGHDAIARGRKWDPGPAFPMAEVRGRVLAANRRDDTSEEHEGGEARRAVVLPERLNVRMGPALSAQLAREPLGRGSIVEIVESRPGWTKVRVQTEGWVGTRHLSPSAVDPKTGAC